MTDSLTLELSEAKTPVVLEDQLLIERVVARGRSAFTELVVRYEGEVARLAYRLLGWQGDVDDVVQEVFAAVWRHAGKFRGQSSFRTWTC